MSRIWLGVDTFRGARDESRRRIVGFVDLHKCGINYRN
jgi:hypothetical protein